MADTIEEALGMIKEARDFLSHYREMKSNPKFHDHYMDLRNLIEDIESDLG